MQLHLFIDNIKSIMLYCNIETLINIGSSCKSIRNTIDTNFWLEKFSYDDLMIIMPRDNYLDWITEYITVLRSKLITLGIFRFHSLYGLLDDIDIDINIRSFPDHESVNFITQELKNIIKANIPKGSRPCQIVIDFDKHKLIYQSYNNEDEDDYIGLGSINITLQDIQDILIKILYINEQLRTTYSNNDHVLSEGYMSIGDYIPLIYDQVKYNQWITPQYKDVLLSYWELYLDEMFIHYGKIVKHLFQN